MATPGGLRPLRPPNPAALLVRPPPQGALGGGLRPLGTAAGPASLLLRPPPSGPENAGGPLTGATGAAALLLRPPPSPTDLSPSSAPGGLRPAGVASDLVRPPPSQSELAGQTSPPGPRPFGAAALLVRPPPNGTVNGSVEQAGTVSSSPLVRPPANHANHASDAVSPESTTASIWPPPPGAEIKAATAQPAEDWDGYGPAWDGYGTVDEASPTEQLEPKSKEADVTDAVGKLPEEPAESAPEPRKDQKHIFITSQPGTGKTTLIHKLLQKLTEEDGEGGVDIFGFYTEEVKDPENPKQRLGFDVVRVGEVEEGAPKRAVLARVGQALPKVGKYTVDVAAFEAFALPALEPPKEEIPLPPQPRLYRPLEEADVEEKVVSLLYEPGDDEEGANSRIRLEFGEELNVPPSSLREVPSAWKHPDEEEEPVPRLCVVDEVGKMGLLSVQFPKTLSQVLNTDVVLATGVQTAKGQRDPEAVEDIKKRNGCRVIKLTRNNRDSLVDQTYAQLRESLGLGPPGTGKPRVRIKKKKEEERKAKERAEREAREREEKEREEAAEKEKAARRERQMAKEKARAERLAKERAEREVEAAKARAERKRRAEARKKAMEDAKNGVVPCVEHEDADDVEEMAPSFDLVDDAIEVEEAPRKRRRALSKGGSMASLPSVPSPGSPEASPMDASPVAEASPSSPMEPPIPAPIPPVTVGAKKVRVRPGKKQAPQVVMELDD